MEQKGRDTNVRNSAFSNLRAQWSLMNAYARFEQVVVIALGVIIAAVIIMAMLQLCRRVLTPLVSGAIDP